MYKLRAADAKERQYWVSRLRNEIERCTSVHSGYTKTQVCFPQRFPPHLSHFSLPLSLSQVPLPSTTPTPQHTHTSTVSSSPLSPSTTSTDKTTALSSTTPLTTPTRRQSRSKGRGLAAFTSRASLKKKSKGR